MVSVSDDEKHAKTRYLTRWESEMKMGEEMNHVTDLLHSSSMRGTDDLGI